MDAQDWRDMATVYWAGAQRASGWSHNALLQQLAEILEEMTTACETIAWTRGSGGGILTHRHMHQHADGSRHIDGHDHAIYAEDHAHVHPPADGPTPGD